MVQGLFGLLLLAVSVLSTALNILGFLGLVVAWIGLGVYFFTGDWPRLDLRYI